jgi:hypothetical protein
MDHRAAARGLLTADGTMVPALAGFLSETISRSGCGGTGCQNWSEPEVRILTWGVSLASEPSFCRTHTVRILTWGVSLASEPSFCRTHTGV